MLHFFVGRPVIRYSNRIKSECKSKQAHLQESENLIRILPNPRKAIEEIETKLSDLSDVGVTKKQIPRIVQLLGKSAVDANINIISIKPRDDLKSYSENLPAGVTKAYIEMELTSTYKDFGEYIKLLLGLQPGFTVESIEMQKASDVKALKTPEKVLPQDKLPDKKVPGEKILLIRLIVSTYMIWEL